MLYAAYGTEVNQDFMHELCRDAKLFKVGKIDCYRLVFEHSANIILDKNQDKSLDVPVLVWDISDSDVERLDRYYNCPMLYKPLAVDVNIGGSYIPAYTYVLNKDTVDLECPYSVYEDVMREGYIENGFDIGYLKDAVEESFYASVK